MRFIHTADWQLGKPFQRFGPSTGAALSEARLDAIDGLGRAAEAHKAGHILVAGDVFDTPLPDDRLLVQAISRMERYRCRWWLLPGNHDHVQSGGLWDRFRRHQRSNIELLTEFEPREMDEGAMILPAPLIYRHHLDDPTAWMDDAETPAGALRIGLAHGSVASFGSRETPNRIAVDRADTARLDYLALGDWHGQLQVGPRTHYSGTPEVDAFGREEAGRALLVDVVPGEEARVQSLSLGKFRWLERDWAVERATDIDQAWATFQQDAEPATTLLKLKLSGAVSLAERVAILSFANDSILHSLRHLDLDDSGLVAAPTDDDLATFDIEGALGIAARQLRVMSDSGGHEGDLARRALERLFIETELKGQAA